MFFSLNNTYNKLGKPEKLKTIRVVFSSLLNDVGFSNSSARIKYIALGKKHLTEKTRGVVVHHEFFHLYQNGSGTDDKTRWLVEGTAEWYNSEDIDLKLMLKNHYIFGYNEENLISHGYKGGFKKVLEEVGFIHEDDVNKNSINKYRKNSSGAYVIKSSGYHTFGIWRMINTQCDVKIKDNIKTIMSTTLQGVHVAGSLNVVLNGMNCNFYNMIEDVNNREIKLPSALAYYQYATIKEGAGYFFGKKSSKNSDGNHEIKEKYNFPCTKGGSSTECKFSFDQSLDVLDISKFPLIVINKIPNTGAKSFGVKGDNNKSEATLLFSHFKQPLSVSIISKEKFCYRDIKSQASNNVEEEEEENTCSNLIFTEAVKSDIPESDGKPIYKTSFIMQPNVNYEFVYGALKENEKILPELFVTIINTSGYASDVTNKSSRNIRLRSASIAESNPIDHEKHKVELIYGTGKINAKVNYKNLHPTKKVHISVTRLTSLSDADIEALSNPDIKFDISKIKQGAVVAEMEVDTSNVSSFSHLFDNLEAAKYGLLIYSEDKTFVYDYAPAEVFATKTTPVELEFDMKYQKQNDQFPNVVGKWEITDEDTGDISIVKFLSGGEMENISGNAYVFHDTEKWSINAKGQIETRFYFSGILLTTMTHKIIKAEGEIEVPAGCKRINTTHSHSGLNKNSIMCRAKEEV